MGVTINHTNEQFFREVEAINHFFGSSPWILSSKGFISDPFVQMGDFLQAHPDNLTAKIFFEDSKELYRVFGLNSKAYFTILYKLFSTVLAGSSSQFDIHKKLLDILQNTSVNTLTFDAYNAFLDKGFTPVVLDAILQADGGYLRVLPSQTEETTITEEEGFVFHVQPHSNFSILDASIILLEKPLSIGSLSKLLANINNPAIVVLLSNYHSLEEFGRLNDSPNFHLVIARPEYKVSEFSHDLKSYTSQSVILQPEDLRADSVGHVVSAELGHDTLRLKAKHTFSLDIHIRKLMLQESKESSPLIKQTLQSRIHNLSGKSTFLNVGAPSNLEVDLLIQKYVTEILEVSNIILNGIVESNSFSTSLNNISANCFARCFNKAIESLFFAMSEVRVSQKTKE